MKRSTFIRVAGMAGAAVTQMSPFELAADAPATRALQPASAKRRFGAWSGGFDSDEKWKRALERMRKAGMNTILPDVGDDELRRVIPLAREEGIDVHAWRVQMRSGEMIAQHPEWYAVSRNGESTAVKPPYVGYYQFMCPSRDEVRDWVVARARSVAKIDGLASVHLDYIRLPDVILPVALWPKYNLVQDHEMPEFDYCYCDVCRSRFREQTGLDPMRMDDPAANEAWRKFRWDAITRIVNAIHDAVHAEGNIVTAAVFPTPSIARALVRQDWPSWKVDELMPMIYNGFYNEPVEWVGKATRECVTAVAGKVPIHTGLYLPDLDPAGIARAATLSVEAGAAGVVVFDLNAISDAHMAALAGVMRIRNS